MKTMATTEGMVTTNDGDGEIEAEIEGREHKKQKRTKHEEDHKSCY
jgi:hypothetical protein